MPSTGKSKIVIIGAGLTGVSYALLLKEEGFRNIEIWEKRSEEETNKLDASMLYLKNRPKEDKSGKKGTLDILSPFVGEYLFGGENPRAYKEGAREGLVSQISFPEEHACVNIGDLLRGLLIAAAKEDIPIRRGYNLKSFCRTGETPKTILTFEHTLTGEMEEVSCDQALLACGSRAIKDILGDKYAHPVEIHGTHTLIAVVPTADLNDQIDLEKTATIAVHPEYKYGTAVWLAAQAFSFWLKYAPSSVGYLALYLRSPLKTAVVSTLSPEEYDELMKNSAKRVQFMRDRARNMVPGLSGLPGMTFGWLNQVAHRIEDKHILPALAFSSVLVPDRELLKQGVITVGDGFTASSYLFGSEFNEHLLSAIPIILSHLKRFEAATEYEQCLDELVEGLWNFITSVNDPRDTGRVLKIPDLMGNTILKDGSRANMSFLRGITLDDEEDGVFFRSDIPLRAGVPLREWLEKEIKNNPPYKGWLDKMRPPYQDGGLIDAQNPDRFLNSSSFFSQKQSSSARTEQERAHPCFW